MACGWWVTENQKLEVAQKSQGLQYHPAAMTTDGWKRCSAALTTPDAGAATRSDSTSQSRRMQALAAAHCDRHMSVMMRRRYKAEENRGRGDIFGGGGETRMIAHLGTRQ
jgi:hypothetical protein